MKKKDKQQARLLSLKELGSQIRETQMKLAEVGRDRFAKQPKDLRSAKKLRQKIAVLKTILQEKELIHE